MPDGVELEKYLSERNRADQLAQLGDWKMLTQANFPQISSCDQETLRVLKLQALSNRFWKLDSIRTTFPETSSAISKEMSEIQSAALACQEPQEQCDEGAECPIFFGPPPGEVAGLRHAIEYGLVSVITDTNFPSLRVINPKEKDFILALALTNALRIQELIKQTLQETPGFDLGRPTVGGINEKNTNPTRQLLVQIMDRIQTK